MRNPEDTLRAMRSGSIARKSYGVVARNLMLATIDIVGPERNLRDLHGFVSLVGRVEVHSSQLALFGLLRSGDIEELREDPNYNPLFFGYKFAVNPEHEKAVALAQTDSVRLLGRQIGRETLSRLVERQIEGDVAHREVELEVRALNPSPTYID